MHKNDSGTMVSGSFFVTPTSFDVKFFPLNPDVEKPVRSSFLGVTPHYSDFLSEEYRLVICSITIERGHLQLIYSLSAMKHCDCS